MFTSKSLHLPFTLSIKKESINAIRTDLIVPHSLILEESVQFNLKIYSAIPFLCENNTGIRISLQQDNLFDEFFIFDRKTQSWSIPIKIGTIGGSRSIRKAELSLRVSSNSCDSIYDNHNLDPIQVIYFS